MKILLGLLSLTMLGACTKKYQSYSYIEKREFVERQSPTSGTRPPRLMSGKKETEKFCEGQILFNKNAEAIAEASLPALISQSCPGSEYLLDAKITRLWWTVLVYSRSCVEVESFCPKKMSTQAP